MLPAGRTVEVLWSPHLARDVGWVMREAGVAGATPLADLQRRGLCPREKEAMMEKLFPLGVVLILVPAGDVFLIHLLLLRRVRGRPGGKGQA